MLKKSKLKYYDSIHNCIVKRWDEVKKTGDYRHLLILPSYKKLPECDIDLESVFHEMIREKYDEFGYLPEEEEILRREAKRNELEIKYQIGYMLLNDLLNTEYGTDRYNMIKGFLKDIKIRLDDSQMQMSYIGAVQNLLQGHKSIINSVQRIDRELALLNNKSEKPVKLSTQQAQLMKLHPKIDFNYNTMTVVTWFTFIEMSNNSD